MNICFPILENRGIQSTVNNHFGSTESFLIYDDEKQTFAIIQNSDAGHAHGACQPLKSLNGHKVDAVVLGGIGMGALLKLNAMGIKVYRARNSIVEENINYLRSGELPEITSDSACSGHGACHHE